MGNWKKDYISTKFDPDLVPNMKKEYGKLLAKHNRNSDKAFVDPQMDMIFKSDVSAKLYAKNNWVFDNEVKSHVEHYLSEGLTDILPTKEEIAKKLLQISESAIVPREQILALQTYLDLMGWSKNTDTTGVAQNVILITDNGDKLTWEEKVAQNQHNLEKKALELLDQNE